MVRRRLRPPRCEAAGKRREPGLRQQLRRQGPHGPGRNPPGGRRIFPPLAGAGSESCRYTRRRARSTPGPAIPTRRSIWPRSVRGWCWFPFWKDRPAARGTSFPVSCGCTAMREVGSAARRSDTPSRWPNCSTKAAPGRKPPRSDDWPTFAGSPARNAIAPEVIDVGGGAVAGEVRARLRRFPLRRRPWPMTRPRRFPFILQSARDESSPPTRTRFSVFAPTPAGRPGATADLPFTGRPRKPPRRLDRAKRSALRVIRLTIADGRLYARMGSPITNPPQQAAGTSLAGGSIVCLDLRAEGKLLWRAKAEEGWAFDGAPVVDGERLFVAMRRADIRPQAHVACFDTTTGRMRWRRFICAAETPARAALAECTQQLAHASRRHDLREHEPRRSRGRGRRLRPDQLAHALPAGCSGNLARMDPHWSRDLNPCLFDRGRLVRRPGGQPKGLCLRRRHGTNPMAGQGQRQSDGETGSRPAG